MTMLQVMSALLLLSMFGGMAWLIAHARTETIYRPLAIAAFLVGFPVVWWAMSVTTGSPKPSMLYNTPVDATLLGWKPDTGKDLYVLLDLDDGSAPIYYHMPWDSKVAEQIEQAVKEGKGTVKLKFSKRHNTGKNFDFEWPWDTPAPEVYVEPTENKMPDKVEGDPQSGFQLPSGSGNDPQ